MEFWEYSSDKEADCSPAIKSLFRMNEASAQSFFSQHFVDNFIAFISTLRFILMFLVDLCVVFAFVVNHVSKVHLEPTTLAFKWAPCTVSCH